MSAKSVNKVLLLGNVGKDPEVKFTSNGTAVANLSLATSEHYKDKQGQQQERTEWHHLVAYQRTAEVIRDYVKKGSKLYIEGRIQTRSWDDRDSGQKKYKTEIVIADLGLLSSNGQQNGGKADPASQHNAGSKDTYSDLGIAPDDIPF